MPNNFPPLSPEELRELWNDARSFQGEPSSERYWKKKVCRLILSAIWWEAMADDPISEELPEVRQRLFLTKLREVGIDYVLLD